tara:strand:+ start:3465 stop:3800 length:336 start_codon:yes stop_codon:yes gene_type:complete
MIPIIKETYVQKGTIYEPPFEIILDPSDPLGRALAVQYYDKRYERYLSLSDEGTVFRRGLRNNLKLFSEFELGFKPNNQPLQILQSGLHAKRFEFIAPMPWVFIGTAGYGI